ncbi:MAG: OmpA family protein [Flavobacteriales bacterium]
MRFLAISVFILVVSSGFAQRKLPDISFKHGSTDYADANRRFDDDGQYVDTLRDEHIVKSLVGILKDNPQLKIELGGHTAINEDTLLAIQRAEKVKLLLLNKGIPGDRIAVQSYGHRKPVISDETVLMLSASIEREAANQRNRRVEVRVIDIEN